MHLIWFDFDVRVVAHLRARTLHDFCRCRRCLPAVSHAVAAYDEAAAAAPGAAGDMARRAVLMACAAELCAAPKARVGAHACAAVLAGCAAGHAPEACCAPPAAGPVSSSSSSGGDGSSSSSSSRAWDDAACERAARVLLAATRARDEPAALRWAMLLFEWCSRDDLRALWELLAAERPAPLREFYRGAAITDLDASGGRLFLFTAILLLCRDAAAAPGPGAQAAAAGGAAAAAHARRVAAAYAPDTRVVVPDYARDKHTAAGKRLGRGFEHFWAVAGAVHPAAEGVPDAYREAARAVYAAQEAGNGAAHRTKHIRARLATHFAAVRAAFAGPAAAAAAAAPGRK